MMFFAAIFIHSDVSLKERINKFVANKRKDE